MPMPHEEPLAEGSIDFEVVEETNLDARQRVRSAFGKLEFRETKAGLRHLGLMQAADSLDELHEAAEKIINTDVDEVEDCDWDSSRDHEILRIDLYGMRDRTIAALMGAGAVDRQSVRRALDAAEQTIRMLSSLGSDYQAIVAAEPKPSVNRDKRLRGISDAVSEMYVQRQIRSLQILGAIELADFLKELWSAVAEVTTVYEVAIGIEPSDILQVKIEDKRLGAEGALHDARAALGMYPDL